MKRVLSLALFTAVLIAASRATAGCTWENNAYFDGQVVCQFGLRMKCVDGTWTQTGDRCFESDTKESVVGEDEAANPPDVEMKHEAESPPGVDVP